MNGERIVVAPRTILLIDDDVALLEVIAEALSTENFQVITAKSCNEALSKTRDLLGPIHLIIADLVLGEGMTGFDCVRRLHLIYKDVKTLYISGHAASDPETLEIMKKETYFLEKPFSIPTLFGKISEILDGSGFH